MALWWIAEKATTKSLIASLNDDEKYTNEMWHAELAKFRKRLNEIVEEKRQEGVEQLERIYSDFPHILEHYQNQKANEIITNIIKENERI